MLCVSAAVAYASNGIGCVLRDRMPLIVQTSQITVRIVCLFFSFENFKKKNTHSNDFLSSAVSDAHRNTQNTYTLCRRVGLECLAGWFCSLSLSFALSRCVCVGLIFIFFFDGFPIHQTACAYTCNWIHDKCVCPLYPGIDAVDPFYGFVWLLFLYLALSFPWNSIPLYNNFVAVVCADVFMLLYRQCFVCCNVKS